MSVFARLKKKRKDAATVEPAAPVPTAEPAPPTPPEEEPESVPPQPSHAVEIQSIFTGLHLSANVASQERDDSPYMKRAASATGTEPESPLSSSEQSSFTFLNQSLKDSVGLHSSSSSSSLPPAPLDGPEQSEEKSSFTFLNSERGGAAIAAPQTTPPPVTAPADTGKSVFGFITSPTEVEKDGTTRETSSFNFLNRSDEPVAQEKVDSMSSPPPSQANIEQATASTESNQEIASNKSIDPVGRTLSPGPLISPNRLLKVTKPAVGRQQPQAGMKKKKKLKAVRPGQPKAEDGLPGMLEAGGGQRRGSANREADSLSLSSQASSLEGGGGERPGSGCPRVESPKQPAKTSESTSQQSSTLSLNTDAALPLAGQQGADSQPTEFTDSEVDPATTHTQEAPIADTVQEVNTISVDITNLVELGLESDTQQPGTDSKQDDAAVTQVASEDMQLLSEVFTPSPSPKPANYDVELSSSDQLTTLLESSQSGLDRIRLSLLEAREGHSAVVERSLSAARQLRTRRGRIAELKEQVAKALAEENYEEAEELNAQLEDISLDHEWSIAANCLAALRLWMNRCCEAAQSEEEFRSDISAQLAKLREEQTDSASLLEREVSSLQAKEKMRLKTLEDKIEREKGHMALDREHLERQEQLLEEETSRRAADFIAARATLRDDLESIEEEITSLESKLAALRLKQSSVLAAITEENGKIQCVHDELASEHGQLETERQQLTARETELQQEVDNLDVARAASELAYREQETRKTAISEVIIRLDATSEQFTTASAALEAARSQTTATLLPLLEEGRAGLKYSAQLTSLQEVCNGREVAGKELTALVLGVQAEISSLRKKTQGWEEQLTQLRDAKKTAVTGRQFKEAARIAAEIKSVSEEVSQAQVKIASSEEELVGKNRELSRVNEELAAGKEEVELLERKEDEAHISLLLKACALVKAKSSIVSASPLAEVMTKWSTLYQLLAENLCQKHSVELAHYQPPPAVEGEEPGEANITDDEKISAPTSAEEPPATATAVSSSTNDGPPEEERTPGEGMEVEGGAEQTALLQQKAAEIEAAIEVACTEEDYDKAAELDDELKKVQSSLKQLQV